MPFGVSIDGPYAPSFIKGEATKLKIEYIKFPIIINSELAQWLTIVEEWAKKQVSNNSKDIFGRTLSAAEIDAYFQSCLKSDELNTVSVKMQVVAHDLTLLSKLTKISVIEDTVRTDVSGWKDFEPFHTKYRGFVGASCRVIGEVNIWTMSKQFGVHIRCSDIMLWPRVECTGFKSDEHRLL
jgi:hypothetical protein